MQSKKKFWKKAAIAVCIAVFLSLLFSIGFLSNIQLKLSDGLYGGKQPHKDIVIIAIDDKSLQEIGRWPWDRANFADMISHLNNSKIVGIDVAFFEPSNENSDKGLVEAIAKTGNVIVPVEYTSYSKKGDELAGEGILLPIDGIEEAALGLGYINIITDKDGVTRAVNMDVKGKYSSFTEIIYKHYTGKEFSQKSSRFLINFAGAPDSFAQYSFSDVLNGKVEYGVFENRLVLIGSTSPDMHDEAFVPTSHGKAMNGVEIHANTLQTMINRDLLSNEPYYAAIIFIFLFCILSSALVYHTRVWVSSLINIGFIFVYVILSILVFDKGIIMDIVYVPLAIIFGDISSIAFLYLAEKKEKTEIMNAFSKYVSPVLVRELMEKPEQLKLGGDKREITVMFSDIRSFTTLSEKLSPEKLVHLLNRYLTVMTNIIMDNKGLVDKFIGDAIMAFWGAPLKENEHAKLACSSSLEMIKKLKKLNEELKQKGEPEINIGIGLSTGDAVIGNMGSENRFDYTAMGDTVNLGSRLEGATKQYHVRILMSELTRKEIGDDFVVREIDYTALKGKDKPIRIYELIARKGEAAESQLRIRDSFEKGFLAYRKKQWDAAIKLFEECSSLGDETSQLFIERCAEYKKNPPSKDWDGVWKLKEK